MISETTYDQHPPDREFGPTVLLVDDEEHARDRLKLALSEVEGADSLHIIHCTDLTTALETIAGTTVHIVLLDKELKKDGITHDGIDAIPLMLHYQPHLQILMVTGSNDIQDVVRAMRNGACGYVTKELDITFLIENINRALENARLRLDKIRRDRNADMSQPELGGRSRVFQELLKQGQLLSESNRPILLLGPTGTGKTEFAKWINKCRQKYLKQLDRPFFSVNAATLTKELIESELFGHEKGSFTGATSTRQGLFELANNGTIFFDEIGELDVELQAKLLTVIEGGPFKRIGGQEERRSSPKLIFATNRDLVKMVADGKFREDLLNRINMFPLKMPLLADRREDVPDIVRALLLKSCEANDVYVKFEDIPQDFIEYLSSEDTHIEGNIRGIRNQLDRLLVLSPKDRTGRPNFKKWKYVPGLFVKQVGGTVVSEDEPLTLAEVANRPTHFISQGFPGLNEAVEIFKRRILFEAAQRFKRNTDIAKALKIPESSASVFMRRLQADENSVSNGTVSHTREEGVFQ